jgi:serine/threonine-protein kinase
MDEKSGFREQMPQTIGRYQILESIGYGAMGAVYKAFDPLIKRTLAIKTIRLDIPRQSPQYKSFIERFYHEARISGTLSHPNIVTLFDIGEESGIPYLAMEFVEGQTIASMIEKGTRFKPEKVIGLISQIAAAVDYAHSKGVIHRDIKPSNLILYEGDRVKVTDFGIAKLVDAEMTQSGTLLGTPSYMSPEQAMGDKLDGRSDIFSLGVCAFEMLSGEQPFPGNNVTSILYKLVHVDPIEPANLEMNGLVPQKWHEVFSRVLAKKPDDRYQTATEFVQDLEYCLGAWFGAAMGDDSTAVLRGDGGAAAPAQPAPPPEPVSDDVATALLPTLRALTSSAPQTPVPRSAVVRDDGSGPSFAVKLDGAEEHTLRSTLQPPPAAESPEATLMLRAPLAAPAAAAAGSAQSGPTVRMGSEALLAGRQAAASMPASPPAAATAAAPASAPTPASASFEPTVLMSSEALGLGVERTLKAQVPATVVGPPPTVRQPATPGTAPAGRRAATPPTPVPPVPATPAQRVAPAKATAAPGTPAAPPAPAPVARGGQSSMGLWLAAGISALVVGSGTLLFLLRSGASVDPSPSPSAAASLAAPLPPIPTARPQPPPGLLRIESQPAGAIVNVNGVFRGLTPLELPELPLGSYDVRLEMKGFEPRLERVALTHESPHSEVSTTLARVAAAPAMGSADLLSIPTGAAISLDGSPVGVTPLLGYRIKPGSHRVEMQKDGHQPWSGELVVQAGSPGRVEAQLRPIAAPATPAPQPTAEVVDPNRIYLENEVDSAPRKLSGPSTSYPENAPRLRPGEAVSVSATMLVDENGDVVEASITESGGKILDEAVLAVVKAGKYTPATRRGTRVRVRLLRKFTFKAG